MSSAALGKLFRLIVQIRILIQFEQFCFCLLDLLSTCADRIEFFDRMLQHFIMHIVVSVITAGDQLDLSQMIFQELALENICRCTVINSRIIHVADDLVCQIISFGICNFMPVEVIQTGKLMNAFTLCQSELRRFLHQCSDRNVAETDSLLPAAPFDRCFRNHSGRVCEVDQPGIRAELFHVFNDAQDHRDRSECFEHTACSVCFLAEHAVGQRDPLILDSCIQQTDTELCCNKVCAGKCFSSVECQMNFNAVRCRIPHTLCHCADDLKLFSSVFNVAKPDLSDRNLIISLDKAFHQFRCVAAAAADRYDFDRFLVHLFLLFPSELSLS